MKLLIVAQSVDLDNPILGFFHHWIEEFAKKFESIVVICLEKGKSDLPGNVKVLSLGKESNKSRLKYLFHFYKYIRQERKNYDAVFVHMNQEYILLGGFPWKLWGKRVTLWRNHYAGNWLTTLAVFLCDKVFCTSKYSYTAKYKKTVIMPVGIDTEIFKPSNEIKKIPRSVLFLGRIAPSKNVDMFVGALGILKNRGVVFSAGIYGDALPENAAYLGRLKLRAQELNLEDILAFHAGVPNNETPKIYCAHEIFVNLSPSGMYDKTIFEAAACEALPLSSNRNLVGEINARLIFKEGVMEDLAKKLDLLLKLPEDEKRQLRTAVRVYTLTKHSLKSLSKRLFQEING